MSGHFENLGEEAPWNEVGAWGVCRIKNYKKSTEVRKAVRASRRKPPHCPPLT